MAGTNILSAASAAPKIFYSNELSTTASTVLYTAPGSGSAIVKSGSISNQNAAGGSTVNVSLAIVPNAGVNDGTHTVLNAYPLKAADTLSLRDYLVGASLGPGDAIYATVSSANVIDIVITGVEFS